MKTKPNPQVDIQEQLTACAICVASASALLKTKPLVSKVLLLEGVSTLDKLVTEKPELIGAGSIEKVDQAIAARHRRD